MYYVYVLENKQEKYYIGSCSNIDLRLRRHNQNSVRSTKNKGPYRLIYKEEFAAKVEAHKREMQLKSYKSSAYLKKAIINNSLTPSSSLV